MVAAAKKIQDTGDMKYPIALPWLATGDIVTQYDAAMSVLGRPWSTRATKKPQFDSPESEAGLEFMKSMVPYMDPQVTTFDQPKVQQQMFNGTAAMSIMFSGRMNDLTSRPTASTPSNFAFAAPPAATSGGPLFSRLSIDGWSLPANTAADTDLAFQMIAASVSEDASRRRSRPPSRPAPRRLPRAALPYAQAAIDSLPKTTPDAPRRTTGRVERAISLVAQVVLGRIRVEQGQAQMQAAAEKVMAKY